ncbi:hypothetical protein AB0O57_29500 [Streptomyces sp. NPDC091201]|uniref:hypothetical protein n=1 Tax=Streptomyces sp. NPDC091201 TaxID=3155190 RepID=UPI003449A24F
MPIDATEQHDPSDVPLNDLALIAALARLIAEEIGPAIQARMDALNPRLVAAYENGGQNGVVAKVGDQVAARFTVNVTRPKIEVGDEVAFDAYAAAHGGEKAIIQRDPVWEKALLKAVRYDPETKVFVDSRTGEMVPGLKYVPGGRANGNITHTWADAGVGRQLLHDALRSGQFRHLFTDVLELTAGQQPSEQQ